MAEVTFESTLVPAVPAMRRVVIELPEERALALSSVLARKVVWAETEVGDELAALHEALGNDWSGGSA